MLVDSARFPLWRSTFSSDLSLRILCEKGTVAGIYGFKEPKNCAFMWQDRRFYYSMSHNELFDSPNPSNGSALPEPWELSPDTRFYERVVDVSFDGEKTYQGRKIFLGTGHQTVSVDPPDTLPDYPFMVEEYI